MTNKLTGAEGMPYYIKSSAGNREVKTRRLKNDTGNKNEKVTKYLWKLVKQPLSRPRKNGSLCDSACFLKENYEMNVFQNELWSRVERRKHQHGISTNIDSCLCNTL
jgi:hypothetical protein